VSVKLVLDLSSPKELPLLSIQGSTNSLSTLNSKLVRSFYSCMALINASFQLPPEKELPGIFTWKVTFGVVQTLPEGSNVLVELATTSRSTETNRWSNSIL